MNEHYLEHLKIEVTIRNLTASTGNTYYNYVKYFLEYTGKEASDIVLEEVRLFLLFKKSKGITAATLNLYNSSIRFFFRKKYISELKEMDTDQILQHLFGINICICKDCGGRLVKKSTGRPPCQRKT